MNLWASLAIQTGGRFGAFLQPSRLAEIGIRDFFQ